MIINRINQWARAAPDKTALVVNDIPISYANFARAIEAGRAHLSGLSLSPAGVVVVIAASLWEGWLLVMAARAIGRTTVAVQSVEQAVSLGLGSVACILLPQSEQGRHSVAGTALAEAPLIVVPNAVFDGVNAGPLPPPQSPRQAMGDHILFTSGTTGGNKKILVDGALEDRRNAARAELSGFSRQTVFHDLEYGLASGIGFKSPSAVWLRGGCVIIDQTAERYANFLRYPVTYAQTTPETLRAILEARDLAAPPMKSLTLRCGGGFVPLNLARLAITHLSPNFIFGFSSTELATALMYARFEGPDDLIWMHAQSGRVVQVVDEAGAVCPPGVEGELRFQLQDLDSDTYLDDPVASARYFRDGFFYPGDLAVSRQDGRIRVLGRVADVLNVQGRKHAVAPMELQLQQALDVEEVCMFSGLAEDGVEEVVIAVQTKRMIPPEDFQRALGGSKIWERVRVVVLREFPRTDTGLKKTRRAELRRLVFQSPP